ADEDVVRVVRVAGHEVVGATLEGHADDSLGIHAEGGEVGVAGAAAVAVLVDADDLCLAGRQVAEEDVVRAGANGRVEALDQVAGPAAEDDIAAVGADLRVNRVPVAGR